MRNSLFMLHIDRAESRMGLTFPTAPLSPIFRVFVPRHWFEQPEEFGILGTLELSPGYPKGITRAWQHPCDTPKRNVATQLGRRSPACPAPKEADVRGISHLTGSGSWKFSPTYFFMYLLKAIRKMQTYSFLRFSIFSSSVEKKKRCLVGKNEMYQAVDQLLWWREFTDKLRCITSRK